MSEFDFFEKDMTDEEWAKRFVKIGNEISAMRNVQYVVNKSQLDKFTRVFNFFSNAADELGGEICPMKLRAIDVHGGVTATFPAFDIAGDDIQRFCDAIGCTSALSIDATTGGDVCISVTIPYVFIEKE